MPSWFLKAAVQGVLSTLPEPQRYNRVLQRYVTRSLRLSPEQLLDKWRQAERHLRHFVETRGRLPGTALEMGTGWLPIVPVCYALCGVREVVSIDLQRLFGRREVFAVLSGVRDAIARGELAVAPERLSGLESALALKDADAETLLSSLGIRSVIGELGRVELPRGHFELVTSNNTLEHIPPPGLRSVVTELGSLLGPEGLMSHHIDLCDHYALFDSRIGRYNFLRYSDRRWRWFNSRLQYQNRLRINDYRAIFGDAGQHVIREDCLREPPEALRGLRLDARFVAYDPADLLVYDAWLVSAPGRHQRAS